MNDQATAHPRQQRQAVGPGLRTARVGSRARSWRPHPAARVRMRRDPHRQAPDFLLAQSQLPRQAVGVAGGAHLGAEAVGLAEVALAHGVIAPSRPATSARASTTWGSTARISWVSTSSLARESAASIVSRRRSLVARQRTRELDLSLCLPSCRDVTGAEQCRREGHGAVGNGRKLGTGLAPDPESGTSGLLRLTRAADEQVRLCGLVAGYGQEVRGISDLPGRLDYPLRVLHGTRGVSRVERRPAAVLMRPYSRTLGRRSRPLLGLWVMRSAAARLSACCSRRSMPKSSARIGPST